MRSHLATQLPLTTPLLGPLRWRRHRSVQVVYEADAPARVVLDALTDARARDAAHAVANWLEDALGHAVAFEPGDAPAFVLRADDAEATWPLLAVAELVTAWLDDGADDPFAALGRVSSAGVGRLAARDDADRAVLAELHPALLTTGEGPAWWLRPIAGDNTSRWLAVRHVGAVDVHRWRARLGVPLVSPAPTTGDAIARALHAPDTHVSVLAWADEDPIDAELAARVAARAAAHARNTDLLHRLDAMAPSDAPGAPRRGPAVFERIGREPTADAVPASAPAPPRDAAPPAASESSAAPAHRPTRRAALEPIGADHPAPPPTAPALPPASDPGRFDVVLVDVGPDATRTARVLAAACGVSADQATRWCEAPDARVAEGVTAAEARRIDGMVRPATGAELRVERLSRP